MANKNDLIEEIVGMAEVGIGMAKEKVLARITFPKRWSDRPTVVLNPTSEQFQGLAYMGGRELSLVLKLGPEDQQTLIETDGLWILRSNQTHWSDEVRDCRIEAKINGIWRKKFWPIKNDDPAKKTDVRFWISPNNSLHGFRGIESDFRGNRKVEIYGQQTIQLSTGATLSFRKNYYWWSEEGIEAATNYVLVADSDIDMPISEFLDGVGNTLEDLNYFLLIVSIATRTRTACYGWDASSENGLCSRYLPDISIPTGYSEPSLNDGLIKCSDLEEFYRLAYPALIRSAYKESIAAAIYALVPPKERFLESEFISIFSSLEHILLTFRRAEKLEYALSTEEFTALKNCIEKTIKEKVSEKSSREKIKAKILDLNRVPVSYAYEKFIEKIEIEISDLWPVFNRKDGVNLYQLRNWLSHGEPIPDSVRDQMWIANSHLRWTVERIALKLLGWSSEKSEVSPKFLKTHAAAMRDYVSARSTMSKIMINS